jgi:FMN phosphatase YigB (HAD superfamily)
MRDPGFRPVGIIVTDLDNTLYDWIDYFAPAFRAMMHVLHRKTGLSEVDLLQEARAVYLEHGSLEYSWLVQSLDSVKGRPPEEIQELVKAASGAFRRVRKSRLAAYPGVKKTLHELRDCSYLIVAASNAPRWLAAARLSHLNIIDSFDGLVGGIGHPPSEDDAFARVKGREFAFLSSIPWTHELSPIELKPSARPYELIASQFKIGPESIWVIGDSVNRDLAPARSLGMHTVWARYGLQTNPKNLATILEITPWTRPHEVSDYSAVETTIDSFDELRDAIFGFKRLF